MDDERELQYRVVAARAEYARQLFERGQASEAERLYKQALAQAQALKGPDDFLTGWVLIDLVDVYDDQGRKEEAAQAWAQIRTVVIHACKRLGIQIPQK